MKDNFDVCSWIQIEEIRITRQVTVPRQIWFELNPEIIIRLEHLRQQNLDLKLQPELAIDLRYYALINSGLISQIGNLNFPSWGMTFTSHYLSSSSKKLPITAIRSKINLSGKISQEIQQELWHQPQLSQQIITIHYWLIEQVLQQLPLPRNNYLALIIWSLWLAIAIVITSLIWIGLSFSIGIKIILIIISILILKKMLNYLIRTKLKQWAIQQANCSLGKNKINLRKLTLWLI